MLHHRYLVTRRTRTWRVCDAVRARGEEFRQGFLRKAKSSRLTIEERCGEASQAQLPAGVRLQDLPGPQGPRAIGATLLESVGLRRRAVPALGAAKPADRHSDAASAAANAANAAANAANAANTAPGAAGGTVAATGPKT
jgi:hypothetical protein